MDDELETHVLYVSASGDNKNPGTLEAPRKTLKDWNWPEGPVALFLEEGHALEALTIPGTVTACQIMPYVSKGHDRAQVATKVPAAHRPILAALTASCGIKAWNLEVSGTVQITTQGAGEKDSVSSLLVHCMVNQDVRWIDSVASRLTMRDCQVTGDLVLTGTGGERVHLQRTRCREILVDDRTEVELICGSTELDPQSERRGMPVDCCQYTGIRHVVGKALPSRFLERKKEYGTGLATGPIDIPEFVKESSHG